MAVALAMFVPTGAVKHTQPPQKRAFGQAMLPNELEQNPSCSLKR
jgi:hypothetical protein